MPWRDKITETDHSLKYATFSTASYFEYTYFSTCPISRHTYMYMQSLNTYIFRINIYNSNI